MKLGVKENGRFGDGYCIEPEVSWKALAEFSAKEGIKIKTLQESSRIIEVQDIHNMRKIDANKMELFFRNYYSNKFPIGANGFTSGGIHFHLFSQELYDKYLENYNVREILVSNLKALPMHAKAFDGSLYKRRSSREEEVIEERGGYVNINNLGSLEFRINDVFDERIVGYYVALSLMSAEGINLKEGCSSDISRKTISRDFSGRTALDIDIQYVGIRESSGRIRENKSSIAINIAAVLTYLYNNGYKKYADMLSEYVSENYKSYLN